MVSYRVMLDVPRELIWFVSGLLAVRRRQIGTRRGTPGWAVTGRRCSRWRGSGTRAISRGLAGASGCRSPRRTGTWTRSSRCSRPARRDCRSSWSAPWPKGVPYLILDGKVVDADRCREKTVSRKGEVIDLWYAGKTHDFGGNIQALFYPCGIPLWVSDVLPGNVHDLAAARENVLGVLRPFLEAMPVLADPGYEGAGHGVHVPVKKPAGAGELDLDTRARNALLRSVRCLGERGFALLTQRWKTLQHVTASPVLQSRVCDLGAG